MGSIGSRGVGVIGLSVVGALAAAFAPASALAAGADYFLKIDGVKGESADARHKGEIEVQSFSWGASRLDGGGQADALTDGLLILRNSPAPAAGASSSAGGASGGGAGKVSMQDMSVMRGPRQSTPSGAAGSVADGGAPAAAGKFGAVSGIRRDDGLSNPKRTHPPLVKILKAVEPGSVTLAMRLPGCAVGTR